MVSDDKLVAVNAAVAEYGQAKFDEGVASVQPTLPDGTVVYTEEQVQAKVEAAIAETKAADTTPFSKEEMDAVHAQLDLAVETGRMNAELVEKAKALFSAVAP